MNFTEISFPKHFSKAVAYVCCKFSYPTISKTKFCLALYSYIFDFCAIMTCNAKQ